MKFSRHSSYWPSIILHLVIFSGLFTATLVEAFLPKEPSHIFEMVDSEPTQDATKPPTSQPSAQLPELKVPEVPPLEIPEMVIPSKLPATKELVEKPVTPPKAEEKLMSYDDFLKKNQNNTSKKTKKKTSRPSLKVPTINTGSIEKKLQNSLKTTEGNTAKLTALELTALQRYSDELYRRLNRAWTRPANLAGNNNLVTTVVFDVSSTGRISNIRLRPSSGNSSFDASVRAAFAQVGFVGRTPTGQGHTFTMSFKIIN